MRRLLLLLSLLLPVSAQATGILTPAANPNIPGVKVLASSAIPMIKAPSGTMGNNCAISAMTALPKTYSGGAFILLPTGAIAAGVPADTAWYWFIGSSTTAGTCYNNTYTSGIPKPPASLTPFATTGPGAFAGTINTQPAVMIAIPAGTMRPNSQLVGTVRVLTNNNANSKTTDIRYGGTTVIAAVTQTTATNGIITGWAANRGSLSIQSIGYVLTASTSVSTSFGATDGAINTGSAFNWFIEDNTAVATDYHIVDSFRLELHEEAQ